jgi:hypothetical protein
VSDSRPVVTIGFLKIYQESTGYHGGYLVTNGWGRPLEFRLTSAVQPNRVQSALYGSSLMDYVQCELIGKTLIEKTSTQPIIVVTDRPETVNVRNFLNVPVVAAVATSEGPPPFGMQILAHPRCRGSIYYSAAFESDRVSIEEIFNSIDSSVDLLEPFNRIRDAMTEARKMGVANRVAA